MSAVNLQPVAGVGDTGLVTERYLSTTEIAALWGVTRPAVNKAFENVEPDAVIGTVRGWTLETVDAVRAARPGRGNWRSSDKDA